MANFDLAELKQKYPHLLTSIPDKVELTIGTKKSLASLNDKLKDEFPYTADAVRTMMPNGGYVATTRGPLEFLQLDILLAACEDDQRALRLLGVYLDYCYSQPAPVLGDNGQWLKLIALTGNKKRLAEAITLLSAKPAAVTEQGIYANILPVVLKFLACNSDFTAIDWFWGNEVPESFKPLCTKHSAAFVEQIFKHESLAAIQHIADAKCPPRLKPGRDEIVGAGHHWSYLIQNPNREVQQWVMSTEAKKGLFQEEHYVKQLGIFLEEYQNKTPETVQPYVEFVIQDIHTPEFTRLAVLLLKAATPLVAADAKSGSFMSATLTDPSKQWAAEKAFALFAKVDDAFSAEFSKTATDAQKKLVELFTAHIKVMAYFEEHKDSLASDQDKVDRYADYQAFLQQSVLRAKGETPSAPWSHADVVAHFGKLIGTNHYVELTKPFAEIFALNDPTLLQPLARLIEAHLQAVSVVNALELLHFSHPLLKAFSKPDLAIKSPAFEKAQTNSILRQGTTAVIHAAGAALGALWTGRTAADTSTMPTITTSNTAPGMAPGSSTAT